MDGDNGDGGGTNEIFVLQISFDVQSNSRRQEISRLFDCKPLAARRGIGGAVEQHCKAGQRVGGGCLCLKKNFTLSIASMYFRYNQSFDINCISHLALLIAIASGCLDVKGRLLFAMRRPCSATFGPDDQKVISDLFGHS